MLVYIHDWLIVVSELRLEILTENLATKSSQMTVWGKQTLNGNKYTKKIKLKKNILMIQKIFLKLNIYQFSIQWENKHWQSHEAL